MTLNSSIRRAALALAAACGVVGAHAAGSVSFDSTGTATAGVQCSSFNQISMDPAGNMTVLGCVAPSSSGAPTLVPSCTVTSSTITAGQSATLSANCTQQPVDSYTWTSASGGPTMNNVQSAILSFPNTGTYTYSVIAHNVVGNSASASGTVTVNAPSSGGTPAGCPTYSQSVPMPVIGAQQQVSIAYNGQLAGLMPNMAQDGLTHTITVSPVQVVGQSTKLTVQLVISKCPGDFPNVITACSKWGTVYQGAMSISAYYMPAVPNPPSLAACQMEEGTQYYLNMRFIGYDSTNKVLTGSSYGCTSGTCMMWITGRIVN